MTNDFLNKKNAIAFKVVYLEEADKTQLLLNGKILTDT